MDNIREFLHNKELYAIAVYRPAQGTAGFTTPPTAPLQVGVLDRPAGYVAAAHRHRQALVAVPMASEFLYVESGRIRVVLYDEDWAELGNCELAAGDHIVLYRGGHEVTMLAPTRLIEVKQGPVPVDGSNKVFRSASGTATTP